MDKTTLRTKLHNYYHVVFEPELIDEIVKVSQYKMIKKDTILLDIGESFKAIPLILHGAIKISHEAANGDEIAIYFLEMGDTCTATFGSGLQSKKSKVRAIAETDAEIILIPIEKLEEWLVKYKSWRDFVMDSYHTRFDEMIETIDTLAFLKMDKRLYKYLVDKVQITRSPVLETTHKEIALDINTSRVVVSRLLKQLENEKKIKLNRNKIEVLEY
ncbi:MAG: Crp/Fnr family transcriptional regulator [Flavobacteriales bacterium]|nr:MAG: Crp/Fnr family transcriptional regulator [Flavobacteriales bacterium]PIE49194.1 MAG: Crp/Fnr family transcriptional regulator [Flavobacteriales bacterium]